MARLLVLLLVLTSRLRDSTVIVISPHPEQDVHWVSARHLFYVFYDLRFLVNIISCKSFGQVFWEIADNYL